MYSRVSAKTCLAVVLGSAVQAFGLYNVHSISGVTEGGILGLTLLLQHWFRISPAVSSLVLNAACYILGAIVLGKSFVLLSIVAGGSFSLFYWIFEQFPPVYPQIAGMPLLPRDAGLKNPHPGKRGNIAAAQLIIRDMGNYSAGLPVRFEYGLSMS